LTSQYDCSGILKQVWLYQATGNHPNANILAKSCCLWPAAWLVYKSLTQITVRFISEVN